MPVRNRAVAFLVTGKCQRPQVPYLFRVRAYVTETKLAEFPFAQLDQRRQGDITHLCHITLGALTPTIGCGRTVVQQGVKTAT